MFSFRVSPSYSGVRFDKYLARRFPFRSRTWWARAVKSGRVLLHERPGRPSTVLAGGEICLVEEGLFSDVRRSLEPSAIDILYRDDHLVVLDKPAGLIVHPLGTLTRGALTCLLADRLKRQIHLVHRLDRMTSGLMVAALSREASVVLDRQFREGLVDKSYLALCHGRVAWKNIRLDVCMRRDELSSIRLRQKVASSGKRSITDFRLRGILGDYCLVEAVLHTGRTHQIRVHLSFLGHPVVRDKLYGPRPDLEYFEKGLGNLSPYSCDWHGLHSWKLAFEHPCGGGRMSFCREPSGPFAGFLARLGWTPAGSAGDACSLPER